MNILFARQSAAGDPSYSGERLINCYAQPDPDRGVGPFVIQWSPGLTDGLTISAGNPVRALYAERGEIYAACGGQLWKIVGTTRTSVGAISDDEETTIAGNGFDIACVAGGEYFVYKKNTGNFSKPSIGALTSARSVTTIDNYIVLTETNSQKFQITGLADATSLNALDFASAESAPDYLVRAQANYSELWLFGTRNTEIWSNTGNADFPFQRISGGVIERGCAFPGSVVTDDNSIFWVGDDRLVYRAQGYQPVVISTPYVQEVLAGVEPGANVQAFAYSWKNHKHYLLNIPGRAALVYDSATSLWHERSTGEGHSSHLGVCACRCGSTYRVGGADGVIYELGGVTDGGQVIAREGVSIPIQQARRRLRLSGVQLHFETGATDVGRDAQVMLQTSRDGRTWGPERWRSLGRAGQYDRLVRWWGLGMARQHQIRWRITDPVDAALYGATAEVA